jgi:hypothetical protein
MPMMPQLSLDRACVTRHSDGSVQVDDPECPVVVTIQVDATGGRARVTSLTVVARGNQRITTKGLSRLPLPQLLHLAALRQQASHPNEEHWRSMVTPKPFGARDWPDEHWRLVWAVFRWAVETRRPGGGFQAVADLWCVARRPTAYRWVSRARDLVALEDPDSPTEGGYVPPRAANLASNASAAACSS